MPPTNEIQAIAARLVETSTLTGLIGNRSYPSKPTKDAILPHVVFWRASGGDGMQLDGRSRLQAYEIRVEVYGRNEEETQAAFEAMVARLAAWQDRENGVQGCFAQGDADEQVLDDVFVSGQTFTLWFKSQ